jgi:hypothetical protein
LEEDWAVAWRGGHIQVDETATGKLVWSWWKCCACGRDLTYGKHIETGFHPDCLRRVGDAQAGRLRSAARNADRQRWRRDHQG